MTSQVAADEELPPEASSAGRARTLIRAALEGTDNEDTLDSAQLAVSEIVTNALLHTGTAMRLRILVSDESLRVELSDSSSRLPSRRHFGTSAPTGRGLLLVDELVSRWGAHPTVDGKVVWFEISQSGDADGLLPEPTSTGTADDQEALVVELRRFPLLMHQAWQEHAAALLRELMLIRLDVDVSALEDHAGASEALSLLLEQIPATDVGLDPDTVMANAIEPRVSVSRLLIEIPRASLSSFELLDSMLDDALRLGQADRLLAPPTQPEIQAMRGWICEQVRHQATGGPASAWPSMSAAPPPPDRVPLGWDPAVVLDSPDAVLAADDANRIIAVSPAALALLGYDDDSPLVGRRLVSIIPERFHQAHIAGFTLHLVNGRGPLIGQRFTVPALRRDGTEVEVGLLIESCAMPEGRFLFTAQFFD